MSTLAIQEFFICMIYTAPLLQNFSYNYTSIFWPKIFWIVIWIFLFATSQFFTVTEKIKPHYCSEGRRQGSSGVFRGLYNTICALYVCLVT